MGQGCGNRYKDFPREQGVFLTPPLEDPNKMVRAYLIPKNIILLSFIKLR